MKVAPEHHFREGFDAGGAKIVNLSRIAEAHSVAKSNMVKPQFMHLANVMKDIFQGNLYLEGATKCRRQIHRDYSVGMVAADTRNIFELFQRFLGGLSHVAQAVAPGNGKDECDLSDTA